MPVRAPRALVDATTHRRKHVVRQRQGAAPVGLVGLERNAEDHRDRQDDADHRYADAAQGMPAPRAQRQRIGSSVDDRVASQHSHFPQSGVD